LRRRLKYSQEEEYLCNPPRELVLVLDQNYLEEFNIKIARGWFPEDKSAYDDFIENRDPYKRFS